MNEMNKQSLSIIMTVHNGEKFITETLDAIFAQTFSDFELVVVNNGCTDGTQSILDGYSDPRLKVIHQTKEKPTFGDGIRLAYENASAEFVAVNDADDVPLPDRFEKQVAALKADDKVALVSGAYEEIDEVGQHLQLCQPPTDEEAFITAIQNSSPLAHSTYMYRKPATDDVGGYVDKYHYGSDFALVVALVCQGWKIKILPDTLMKIRIHGAQASQVADLNVMRAYEAKELYREAAKIPGLSVEARKNAKQNDAKRTLQYAFALFNDAQTKKGLAEVCEALRKNPLYGGLYLLFRIACQLRLMKHPVYNPERS